MMREYLENVRTAAPIVHCITNYVTANDVANMLLACGASPIMSDAEEDVEEITSLSAGLTLNLGTLHRERVRSMLRAGRRAGELGNPILLDPVGVGASSFRTGTALELLSELKLTAIRGNASELRALSSALAASQSSEPIGRGVDADGRDAAGEENLERAIAFLRDFARRTGVIAVQTGPIDLVSDGERCFVIHGGRPEMGRVTGTGCQLSGMLTAFLAANRERPFEAAAAAVCAMDLAGELGWQRLAPGEGNASYRNRIIDAVFRMTGEELERGARYELR